MVRLSGCDRAKLALAFVKANEEWPGTFVFRPLTRKKVHMASCQREDPDPLTYMAVVKPGAIGVLEKPYRLGKKAVNFTRETAVTVTEHGAPDGWVWIEDNIIPYLPEGLPRVMVRMDDLLDIEDHIDAMCRQNQNM